MSVANIKTNNEEKIPVVCFKFFKQKAMKLSTIIISFVFSSVPITSWILPPGMFLHQFALKHNRASITVYLPSTDVSKTLIRNHQKSLTTVKDLTEKSKIV